MSQARDGRMVVLGVTGGVGTGKSTVAGMFRRLGAVVLDADVLAHEAMVPKRLAWRRVVQAFGEGVLNEDQTVNRRRLAAMVFADEERRRQLERILHPPVLRTMKERVHRLRRQRRVRVVVLDVPLLLEAGAENLVDAVVVVTAEAAVQRQRLQQKCGWSEAEIAVRIKAQWDLSAKAALADYVIDNSDGVDATRRQVEQLWKHLAARPSSRSSTSRR